MRCWQPVVAGQCGMLSLSRGAHRFVSFAGRALLAETLQLRLAFAEQAGDLLRDHLNVHLVAARVVERRQRRLQPTTRSRTTSRSRQHTRQKQSNAVRVGFSVPCPCSSIILVCH
jgi:hypothetical protein